MNLSHLSIAQVNHIIGLVDKLDARRGAEEEDTLDAGTLTEKVMKRLLNPWQEEIDLLNAIQALSDDQMVELNAVMVIGRGDNGTSVEDWKSFSKETIYGDRKELALYIAQKAPLANYLRDGLYWLKTH